MPTRLILVRHGQTRWNLEKRYIGFTDIDLNHKGKEEARQLKRRLNKEKIDKVYSSDSKRALHFAKIAFKDFLIEKRPELKEINFGVFEGLTYREIIKIYPKVYNLWLSNPFDTVIPKGESYRDFKKRIIKIFKKIVSLNRNKTLAIVTHAGPIKIIINDILKLKNPWQIISDLASINIIEFKGGKGNLRLLNDTAYLSEGISYGACY